MNLINQYIHKHLLSFQEDKNAFFYQIIELIQVEEKNQLIYLLRYIHFLLDQTPSEQSNKPHVFHLHFTHNLSDTELLVIAQYLLIRFYKESCADSNLSDLSHSWNKSLKLNLNLKYKQLSFLPDKASGKNGGNRIYKKWLQKKTEIEALLKFYNSLGDGIKILSNTIFNCQVGMGNVIDESLKIKPYGCYIDRNDIYPSFNLLNTKLTLNQIDEKDEAILDNLKSVVLFDCERRSMMQHFSCKDILDSGVSLKQYLIFSFGPHDSFQKLKDRLILIQKRFKISNNASYPVLQSEMDYCLQKTATKHIPITFVGDEFSSFWDVFLGLINIQDLYELRSIKMMNLYALCFNEKIKKFILRRLFSRKSFSGLISEDTRKKLQDLGRNEIRELRESLSRVLDLIISLNMLEVISENKKDGTSLVVDGLLRKSKRLLGLIQEALSLESNNKLIIWPEVTFNEHEDILILSYQDQGKYPYCFYPNIVETKVLREKSIKGVYCKFLFQIRYQWAKYNVARDYYKLLSHPIRMQHFHWSKLDKLVRDLKPKLQENTSWDLEQEYSGNSSRETVKVKLKGDRKRTFNSSDLFIYSVDKRNFKVEKISDILDSLEDSDRYFIQHLDDIQENINIYEKIIDTSQQDEELNIIRRQFNLTDSDSGRLWKLLLKQKSVETSEELLYDELKDCFNKEGLNMVSFNHYKNNWLNPESDSMAPINTRVFIKLCDFLGLPTTYYILIRRLRNASKQSSRQSTQLMNRLLQDLFNDGCFDKKVDFNKKITANIARYEREHPLDELGIEKRCLKENLSALIELIKPKIVLIEMEEFKRDE